MRPRTRLWAAMMSSVIGITGCAAAGHTTTGAGGNTPSGEATSSYAGARGSASPTTGSTARSGGQPHAPGVCTATGSVILPTHGCSVVMRPGTTAVLAFPPLYNGASVFNLRQITGTSLRLERNTVIDGNRRLTVTAVRPGATTIAVSAPGPNSAPGAFWTFHVIVR